MAPLPTMHLCDVDKAARGTSEWISPRTGYELLLCSHHLRQHREILEQQGFDVIHAEPDAAVPSTREPANDRTTQ